MTIDWLLPGRPSDSRALRRLLHGVDAVFFDFDGPLCDLFGTTPTAHIAEEIKVMARRAWGTLDGEVENCHDSHGILQHLRNMLDGTAAQRGREPLDEANAIVTRYEYAAVDSAVQAEGIGPLLDLLLDQGKRLVVVSNNAEEPVLQYLKRTELQSRFEAVCGRDPREPRRMKPDPDSVRRALASVRGVDPRKALLVGDQLTDLRAAKAAGVRFLGYTQDTGRRRQMRLRGADGVVASHAGLLEAAGVLVPDYVGEEAHSESK